jgi:AraC-like DNA-binding protein
MLRSPPRVAFANVYPFASGEQVGPHASESSLFVLATSGNGRIQVGYEWFSLHEGSILHVPWDTPILYEAAQKDAFVVMCLHFDYLPWQAPDPGFPTHRPGLKSEARPTPPRPQPFDEPFVLSSPPDAGLFEVGMSIVRIHERRNADRSPLLDALLRGIALQFVADVVTLARGLDAAQRPKAATAVQARIVREIASYLQLELARPRTRLELARRAGVSEAGLSRAFRVMMGKGPIDYLIDLRLAKARQLLMTSHARVGEVAAQVGIPDVYHFSKLFKKRIGCSPIEYRGRWRL